MEPDPPTETSSRPVEAGAQPTESGAQPTGSAEPGRGSGSSPGGGLPGAVGRRRFLVGVGGVAAGAVAGLGLWQGLVRERTGAAPGRSPGLDVGGATPASAADRILVVIQLSGGNDALNALPPADGRYLDARPTVGVPEADRLALPGAPAYGLHPALAPALPAWHDGELALVAGVGIEGQSRSHFAALDTWWSARPGEVRTTGWLGRWLDATVEEDPDNPLRAVALGSGAPALIGERSTATVVLDPAGFRLRAPSGASADEMAEAWLATATPATASGAPLLSAARRAVPATVTATDELADAFAGLGDAGAPLEGETGAVGPLTEGLAAAAAVIDQGLGTRIVHVGAGGFDTHADQVAAHPALLGDLATGLAELRLAARRGGWDDRLAVITVSDFGRRVAENGSGTDHGFGGLQLVCGAGVAGGRVIGDLDLGRLDEGDLAPVVDGRSVYAAALDWLGGPTDEVLGGAHERLGLLA